MKKFSLLLLSLAIASGIVFASSLYRGDWLPNYESKSAAEKMSYLWGKITADRSSAPSQGQIDFGKTTLPTWLGGMDFALIGNQVTDQIPEGVVKGIHAVGHSAKGKFVWNSNSAKLGLTGGFKQGNAENVVARFSNAVSPKLKYVPNVAFKLLRDGAASGNMFGSHQIESQKSQNWFDWGKCNNVHTLPSGFNKAGVEAFVLNQVFGKAGAGNIPTMTGVSEVASHDQSGKREAKVVSPFTVCYQPTKAIHQRNASSKIVGQLYGMMDDIPAGTKLYEVYAMMRPIKAADLKQSDVTHIGHFELTESPTASKFGDQSLFFKHTYWQNEMKVAGKTKEWGFVNEDFLKDEGVEKYEKFFKPEHQINVGRKETTRRLRMHAQH